MSQSHPSEISEGPKQASQPVEISEPSQLSHPIDPSERLASVQAITALRPIPGADFIEAATVLGYQTVVKKGEFREGDLCVWHEPDTVVPERPEYEFLRNKGFRLKIARFKGQVSQGLALPMDLLLGPPPRERYDSPYRLGEDVTALIGIRKYERPVPVHLASQVKGPFPSWLRRTDEPNLRSYPEALGELRGLRVYVTKKIDGTSMTVYKRGGEFGVCSRTLDLKDDGKNAQWRMAKALKLDESLDDGYALQGELYGPSIQGNAANMPVISFAAFNLFHIAGYTYLSYDGLEEFCRERGIPTVPFVCEFPSFDWELERLVELANRLEYAPGLPCEGIVIRPMAETASAVLPNGRLSVKVVSETYAIKYGL